MGSFQLGEFCALGVSACDAACCSILNSVEKKAAVFSVNYIKLLFAAAFLALFRLFTAGTASLAGISGSAWIFLVLSGLVGYVFGDTFFFLSFLYLPYRLSMIIFYSNPIVTSLAAYLLFGQRITLLQGAGIVLTIAGTLTALCTSSAAKQGAGRPGLSGRGILFAALGMLGQGSCVLLSARALELMAALPDRSLLCSQARQLAAIVGFTLYGTLARYWPRLRADVRLPGAVPLIAVGGLTGCAVGTTLLLQAIQYIPVGIATALASLSPLFVVPITLVFYRERIRLWEILGIVVAVAGVALLSV